MIRDADGGEVLRREIGRGKRALDCFACAPVNLHRVVFHPARLRQNLLVFQLVARNFAPRMIKNHKARAGRALINCAHVSSHQFIPSFHYRMNY